MSTNHNEANIGDIAKTVLMPGDPLRAKYFADIYLDNVKQFNSVRNMFGYTGTYKNKPVSIMGSGMGICSIGIYSYELFKHYDVDNIIRVGTCGTYVDDFKLLDTVLVKEAFSFSTYAKVQSGFEGNTICADPVLMEKIRRSSEKFGIKLPEVRTNSSDVIYFEKEQNQNRVEVMRDQYGCDIVECECFALFHNAKVNHKRAAGLMQVVDLIEQNQHATTLQRQQAGNLMFEIALETVLLDD